MGNLFEELSDDEKYERYTKLYNERAKFEIERNSNMEEKRLTKPQFINETKNPTISKFKNSRDAIAEIVRRQEYNVTGSTLDAERNFLNVLNASRENDGKKPYKISRRDLMKKSTRDFGADFIKDNYDLIKNMAKSAGMKVNKFMSQHIFGSP